LFSVALSVREPLGDSRLPLSRDTLPCDVRTFLYSGPETGTATTRTWSAWTTYAFIGSR